MPVMLLRERDVHYVFDKDDAKELGFKPFKYQVWSHGVLICLDVVYCRSKKDFKTLLGHWSRSANWTYKEGSNS